MLRKRALVAIWIAALAACRAVQERSSSAAPADRPYVLVLGSAQDGGLPQLGCEDAPCAAARVEPARRRLVTSLLLCDPRSGKRWLFDCTPDIGAQLERARGHPATRTTEGPRPPLFDGLFLTHAHAGHYGGLLALGREAYAARELATWVTPRFARFLAGNGPWSLLVEERRLVLHELAGLEEGDGLDLDDVGKRVELAPDLFVVPFLVPHRDEFSDTVGFEIHGPERTLVYLPDIDKWEAWDAFGNAPTPRRIEALLARCDVALLDGCFFADGEIPGRSMADIPHPFIRESIERFSSLPSPERAKVFFTHLNHTNPAADERGLAARQVRACGLQVLDEGRLFGL
ncbi:MAG: pyrroloquinoline quinone biosynthesis protein PqqB [Planctomycetes bacterium]|nr:pyrroloquinoline quinone biosynthesis protein PqqB [Planctomycetota bacterium]